MAQAIQAESSPSPRLGLGLPDRLLLSGVWLIAASLLLLLLYFGLKLTEPEMQAAADTGSVEPVPTAAFFRPPQPSIPLPELTLARTDIGLTRLALLHTNIPTRARQSSIDYTVNAGDSVFAIAQKFTLKPETVLWANYDQLQDTPDSLRIGMVLKIPPADGVYYQWKAGDTLDRVAREFKANSDDIVNWAGNRLDLTNPQIAADTFVLIPGGQREFRTWVVPQIARGNAGVSKAVYGPGACDDSYEGAYGSGGFAWPSANQKLSGNDFWSGHLGIDIAAGVGDGVFASDSGVVVFSGWSTGGYGYMIMVDHGNGYQTVYAHLSGVSAACGRSVSQGQYVGAAGSSGNSTGPHLHFEVRLFGQFVNPWHVLP